MWGRLSARLSACGGLSVRLWKPGPSEAVKLFGPPMNADKRGFKRMNYQRSSAFICGLIGFFLSFLRPGLGANARDGFEPPFSPTGNGGVEPPDGSQSVPLR
jgi:hypothetical protein